MPALLRGREERGIKEEEEEGNRTHPGLARSEAKRQSGRRVAGASGQFQTVDSLLLCQQTLE